MNNDPTACAVEEQKEIEAAIEHTQTNGNRLSAIESRLESLVARLDGNPQGGASTEEKTDCSPGILNRLKSELGDNTHIISSIENHVDRLNRLA